MKAFSIIWKMEEKYDELVLILLEMELHNTFASKRKTLWSCSKKITNEGGPQDLQDQIFPSTKGSLLGTYRKILNLLYI